jgi:dipeptidyl aminopeptidase/acylaminoacyl peptidase
MTDHELEQRVRAWYRAEIGDGEAAPIDLRIAVVAIPQAAAIPARRFGRRPGMTLLAAAAVLLVGGALAAGSGLVRLPAVTLVPPSPAPSLGVVPSATATEASAGPTEQASPTPGVVFGGGSILARESPRDANGAFIDRGHGFPTGTYSFFTLDAGSGERTLLGTVPYDWRTEYTPEVRWAADRTHVLITDGRGKVWALDSQTSAGRKLAFACCEQPDVTGWAISPLSDRMAGLHRPHVNVPGQQGITPVTDAVVVSNIDGTGVRNLPLPKGADSGASGVTLSWSPDESAVVIAGCRPCNYADPDKTRTAVTHSHLFIVPVDGSPVRELLDETHEGVFDPSWSPDGASIVVGRRDCQPKEIQPYCFTGRLTVTMVGVADGRQTVLTEAPDLFSGPSLSPVGRRIAFGTESQVSVDDKGGIFVMDADGGNLVRLTDGFDPRWSPDGEWLLFSRSNGDLWIVAAAGGEPRLIGSYGAAAW